MTEDTIISTFIDTAIPYRYIGESEQDWNTEFESLLVTTPIGKVKIGDNQFDKLVAKKRTHLMGLIIPTLSDPTFIIEQSEDEELINVQRNSKLLFFKSFIKDGKMIIMLSVTVSIDGLEISISNHVKKQNNIINSFKNGRIIFLCRTALKSISQDLLNYSPLQTDDSNIESLNGYSNNNDKNMNIPTPIYKTINSKTNAGVPDTLALIKKIASTNAPDMQVLAQSLKGENDYATCRNIWNWVKNNIKYKTDTDGIEEVRTPQRTFHDKIGDCDCMTTLISSILFCHNINHSYRVVAWSGKGNWAHIYPVAHIDNRDVPMDCIPESKFYDRELKYSDKMDLNTLAGIADPTSTIYEAMQVENDLNGYDDDSLEGLDGAEYPMVLSGMVEAGDGDTNVVNLSGSEMAELNDRDILQSLQGAYDAMYREPSLNGVFDNEDAVALQGLITDWCDLSKADKLNRLDKEAAALTKFSSDYKAGRTSGCEIKKQLIPFYQGLKGQAELSSELEGIDSLPFVKQDYFETSDLQGYIETLEGVDQDITNMYLSGLDGDDLGRAKLKNVAKKLQAKAKQAKSVASKVQTKAKTGLKKTGAKVRKTANKIAKTVIRYNPATILLRNSLLAVLKVNMFKISSRLAYGYLTTEQARAKGMDLAQHAKLVKVLGDMKKIFTKTGGSENNLRNAIVNNIKTKGNLGEAATATAAATATPILVKIANLLKTIDFKKLFAKSNIRPTGDELVSNEIPSIKEVEQILKSQNVSNQEDPADRQVASLTQTPNQTQTNDMEDNSKNQSLTTTDEGTTKQNFIAKLWADPEKKKYIKWAGIALGVGLVVLILMWIFKKMAKKSKALAGARKRAKSKSVAGKPRYKIQARKIGTSTKTLAGASTPTRKKRSKKATNSRLLNAPAKRKTSKRRI